VLTWIPPSFTKHLEYVLIIIVIDRYPLLSIAIVVSRRLLCVYMSNAIRYIPYALFSLP
jgi:hypothetical protein